MFKKLIDKESSVSEHDIQEKIAEVKQRVKNRPIHESVNIDQSIEAFTEIINMQVEEVATKTNQKLFTTKATKQQMQKGRQLNTKDCPICRTEYNKKNRLTQCELCARSCCSQCCYRQRLDPEAKDFNASEKVLVCQQCEDKFINLLVNKSFRKEESLYRGVIKIVQQEVAQLESIVKMKKRAAEEEKTAKQDNDSGRLKRIMRIAALGKDIKKDGKDIQKSNKDVVTQQQLQKTLTANLALAKQKAEQRKQQKELRRKQLEEEEEARKRKQQELDRIQIPVEQEKEPAKTQIVNQVAAIPVQTIQADNKKDEAEVRKSVEPVRDSVDKKSAKSKTQSKTGSTANVKQPSRKSSVHKSSKSSGKAKPQQVQANTSNVTPVAAAGEQFPDLDQSSKSSRSNRKKVANDANSTPNKKEEPVPIQVKTTTITLNPQEQKLRKKSQDLEPQVQPRVHFHSEISPKYFEHRVSEYDDFDGGRSRVQQSFVQPPRAVQDVIGTGNNLQSSNLSSSSNLLKSGVEDQKKSTVSKRLSKNITENQILNMKLRPTSVIKPPRERDSGSYSVKSDANNDIQETTSSASKLNLNSSIKTSALVQETTPEPVVARGLSKQDIIRNSRTEADMEENAVEHTDQKSKCACSIF